VDGHIATATKDRTSLFDGQYFTPGTETGEKLRAWLNGESTQDNGQGHPVTRKPEPAEPPKEPMAVTKRGTTILDIFNALRELGLGSRVDEYEAYLSGKYGHGAKDLSPEEIQEQYFNLGRCKHDKKLFEKFVSYLRGLRKAA